ncbi:MAG: branched-chain amino acid ABC transporter permease, partial [Anaerolineae bacterium]|nr:branched-chain amino acid ABC transporter permease [Anaerolineae bacterium]
MLAQQIVSGLTAGCLYALAALGLVLIYRTMDIVNFAHGEMAMVSTFVAYTLLARVGLPYVLAAVGALAFAAVFGMLV